MKKHISIILLALGLIFICNINMKAQQLPITLEAEDAKISGSGPTIGGSDDWKIIENFRSGSSLIYENIEIKKTGVYKFDIYYLTGDTDRPLAITVDGYDAVRANFKETTVHWGQKPTKTSTVYLHFHEGTNTITITPMKDFGPNIDKFVISESDKFIEENVYPYDFTDDAQIDATDPNETLPYLTDNNYTTNYIVNGKTSTTITIDCQHPILLTGYLLSAGIDNDEDVTKWSLEYSADNQSWSKINPSSIVINEYSTTFHVTNNIENPINKTARYFRLTASGKEKVQIGELQLFGVPYSSTGEAFHFDFVTEVTPEVHTNALHKGQTNATYINLFDRNISSYYRGENPERFMVIAEANQPKKLTHYTLTSSSHALERDLKSWKVEGYNGYEWEIMDEVENFVFPARLATMKFTISEENSQKSYQAFRLRVKEINGSTNFQLAQWQLFGENGNIASRPQTEWSKKTAPLTTPWYDTIDLENVLSEYPRPQMVRENWMNLNGIWDFKESISMGRYRENVSFDKKILVPFPIESALSGVMLENHDERPYSTYLYNRTFTVPSSMNGQRILLHFGAVDWKCEVYVNGQAVGTHEGGYDPFYFDITDALIGSGEQELQVQVMDPSDAGGQPVGKQKIHFGGIFYTPSSGIWQTVWLEGVNQSYITNFTITPDIDKNQVILNVEAENANNTNVIIRIYEQGKKVAETEGSLNTNLALNISAPKLWTPDSPFLYDIEMELKSANDANDLVKSYFGMRKISIGEVNGKACFMLNNDPLFQFGPLDQGFWPDGLHTAPSDEALIFDVEKTKEFGFNMTRKHIKTEPARWYYHCDRLGLLVWQDMVNAGSEQNLMGDDTWVKENFIRETENVLNALKNHPSIVSWIIFNEGFGQYGNNATHTRNAYEAVKAFDNTRVINSASGWIIFDEIGEVADMHSYPRPGMFAKQSPDRISVCGEFGGITLVIKDHIWKTSGMVYVTVENDEELKNLFNSYTELLRPLQADGLGAAVYTQITDLEEEVNGLITYDRKVIKLNDRQKEEMRKAIQHTIYSSSIELVPTALRAKNVEWKYTNSTPAENWNNMGFYEGGWKTGISGFGNGGSPNTSYDNKTTVNTEWTSQYIYLRKTFRTEDITDEQRDNLRLTIYYDDDCEVYINGVLAFEAKGYVSNYKTVDVSTEAKAALRANGNNVIAIKCRQYSGGQYIDAGLFMEYSVGDPAGIITSEISESNFILYPNPTDGYCKVLKNSLEELKSIQIFDMAGIKKKEIANSDSFYINDLDKGIYIVEVLTDKATYPLKLIKK